MNGTGYADLTRRPLIYLADLSMDAWWNFLRTECLFTYNENERESAALSVLPAGDAVPEGTVLFWGAEQRKKFHIDPVRSGAEETLLSYVQAALALRDKKEHLAKNMPFLCFLGTEEKRERFSAVLDAEERLCGIGILNEESVIADFPFCGVVLWGDPAKYSRVLEKAKGKPVLVIAPPDARPFSVLFDEHTQFADESDLWEIQSKAVSLFAQKENETEQIFLAGCMRLYGIGRPKDDLKAAALLHRAVALGSVNAALLLCDCARFDLLRSAALDAPSVYLENAARLLQNRAEADDAVYLTEWAELLARFTALGMERRGRMLALDMWDRLPTEQTGNTAAARALSELEFRLAELCAACDDPANEALYYARSAETTFPLAMADGTVEEAAERILPRLQTLLEASVALGNTVHAQHCAHAALLYEKELEQRGKPSQRMGEITRLAAELALHAGETQEAYDLFLDSVKLQNEAGRTAALAMQGGARACSFQQKYAEAYQCAEKSCELWSDCYLFQSDVATAIHLGSALCDRAEYAIHALHPDTEEILNEVLHRAQELAEEMQSSSVWASLARIYAFAAGYHLPEERAIEESRRAAALWRQIADVTHEKADRAKARESERSVRKAERLCRWARKEERELTEGQKKWIVLGEKCRAGLNACGCFCKKTVRRTGSALSSLWNTVRAFLWSLWEKAAPLREKVCAAWQKFVNTVRSNLRSLWEKTVPLREKVCAAWRKLVKLLCAAWEKGKTYVQEKLHKPEKGSDEE